MERKQALGYIKLKEPIRHGWYKEIVITYNVERYKNEKYIKEVIAKVEKKFWGRSKTECNKVWDNEISKNLIYNGLPTINGKSFHKLSEGSQKLCIPFFFKCRKKIRLRYYIRIPKNAYRIKYTKAYITHVKRIDPNLEEEEALLRQQLNKKGYYNISQKGHTWKDDWHTPLTIKERRSSKIKLSRLKKCSINEIKNFELWERN